MAEHDLSKIIDANGDTWNIKAKSLESQISIGGKAGGDVTGTTTSDLSGDTTFTLTIGDSKVTTSKIADGNVTNAKIADSTIELSKLATSVSSGSVSDNDSKLATHAQVKTAIDTAIAGQGSYRGKQTVATINTWTATNLVNGDRVICEDAGTITLGNFSVRAGEDLIFWKSGDTAIWQTMDGEFKLKQTAKTDPTASGTTLTAISSITQDANGDITATKKTIQDASSSQKGVMKVGTGLSASSGTVSVSYGTAANTACQGNDSRLSDSRTPKSHTHGNIQNSGTLQTNDVTVANGDKLVVTDASDSSKVARTSVSFDGSTTTTALTPKGTFEAFAKSADITSAIQALDVDSAGGDGKYISAISETDGKISATATTMDTTPTSSSTKAVTSGGIKTYVDNKSFLGATTLTSSNNLNYYYGSTAEKVRYFQWSGGSAPTNAPLTSSSSIMEVKFIIESSGKYSRQDVWTASGAHYWRKSTSGTWGSWTTQYEGAITNSYASNGTVAVTGTAVAAALGTLDATVTSTDGTNVQVKVTETDGKVSAVNITTDNTENKGNKVTSWSSTTTDTNYPSEKLVKDSLDGKKDLQTAKTDPTASGTGITYIATISQDTQGVISATKSTVRTATTSQTGVVQLSSSSSSSDESKAATPKGVWAAINTLDVTDTAVANKFVTAVSETNGKISVTRAQPAITDVSGLQTALDVKEGTFTIKYRASDNALVFSKTFGTLT